MLPRIEQMLFAIERAARHQSLLADRLMTEGDYAAEIPAADAEALAEAAALIRQVGCVTHSLDDEAFRDEVAGMDADELRKRVLAQASHIQAYARSIDGMGAEVGFEGRRDTREIREAYRRARAFTRAPAFLNERQMASVCFSINHGFGLLSESDQDQMRRSVEEFYRALIKELQEPSQHPMIKASADRQMERKLFGDRE